MIHSKNEEKYNTPTKRKQISSIDELNCEKCLRFAISLLVMFERSFPFKKSQFKKNSNRVTIWIFCKRVYGYLISYLIFYLKKQNFKKLNFSWPHRYKLHHLYSFVYLATQLSSHFHDSTHIQRGLHVIRGD